MDSGIGFAINCADMHLQIVQIVVVVLFVSWYLLFGRGMGPIQPQLQYKSSVGPETAVSQEIHTTDGCTMCHVWQWPRWLPAVRQHHLDVLSGVPNFHVHLEDTASRTGANSKSELIFSQSQGTSSLLSTETKPKDDQNPGYSLSFSWVKLFTGYHSCISLKDVRMRQTSPKSPQN